MGYFYGKSEEHDHKERGEKEGRRWLTRKWEKRALPCKERKRVDFSSNERGEKEGLYGLSESRGEKGQHYHGARGVLLQFPQLRHEKGKGGGEKPATGLEGKEKNRENRPSPLLLRIRGEGKIEGEKGKKNCLLSSSPRGN